MISLRKAAKKNFFTQKKNEKHTKTNNKIIIQQF